VKVKVRTIVMMKQRRDDYDCSSAKFKSTMVISKTDRQKNDDDGWANGQQIFGAKDATRNNKTRCATDQKN
jgi:hypothetical protein